MSQKHPKGLIAASLSNMGERFGFYVMMAILTLFLMSKFELDETKAGYIYSAFYALIYILALAGGFIADKTKNYKRTIMFGIILMALGYLIIAIPSPTPVPNKALYLTITCLGLLVIAFGNGLFKGNLQALVGQMYDNPQYSKMRDSGFSLFYMFINVGAIFAPFMAVGMRNWWLKHNGFAYDAGLPEKCYQFLDGKIQGEQLAEFTKTANEVSLNSGVTDLTAFSNSYLDVFNTGFHYAFGIAIIAMLISLVVYMVNKKNFPDPAVAAANKAKLSPEEAKAEYQMTASEIKQRLYALFAVFAVVIFFWFSFHQNGLTLTYFAKDYVALNKINIDLGFVSFKGAELFQSINPICVVVLTPLVMFIFGWLRARGKEPSTPKKIAIGMGIAAIAYLVMSLGSTGLPLKSEIEATGGLSEALKVSPVLLIITYVVLTIAELFISPLGLSFVSKVAPPHMQGLMQGCWLGATAIGNSLLFIGAIFYKTLPLSATWAIFVGVCLISMIVMFSMLKWLERITK